jgi:outer membrane protein
MKKNRWSFQTLWLLCGLTALAPMAYSLEPQAASKPLKVGFVNFKLCVEESKFGKKEEASFEAMKKQMESVVEEKEKTLNDLANKLNDPDQLDLMSPEAETDLKRKFRALSQELNQLQQQYYQTLNQANFKVIQEISEIAAAAAEKIAKEKQLDCVLNDETAFYVNESLDISQLIIKEMDAQFEKEASAQPKTAK